MITTTDKVRSSLRFANCFPDRAFREAGSLPDPNVVLVLSFLATHQRQVETIVRAARSARSSSEGHFQQNDTAKDDVWQI
jgi:hypothetical protein